MAEIKQDTFEKNDWNKAGNLDDFYSIYVTWKFDWLDVAGMIKSADFILEYPMVDKDPIETWTLRAGDTCGRRSTRAHWPIVLLPTATCLPR